MSRDSDRIARLGRRRAAWEASKKVGPMVVGDLLELVALRNEAARKLGFSDYFVMRLYSANRARSNCSSCSTNSTQLTRRRFTRPRPSSTPRWPRATESRSTELRPWHYHDSVFPGTLVLEPSGIGSQVARHRRPFAGSPTTASACLSTTCCDGAHLDEKPGKCPHAFCEDIDRRGDIRLLQNIVPNEEWLTTMLHEAAIRLFQVRWSHSAVYLAHRRPPALHRGRGHDVRTFWA